MSRDLRPGAKVKGICEAYGQRIVEGSMTFTRPVEPSEVPPGKFYLMRHYPGHRAARQSGRA